MEPLHLRSAGTSLVISFDSGEAEVIHWGADLGRSLPDLAILADPVANSAVDAAVPAGLLPQASSSWRGRPALRGHRIADGGPGSTSPSASATAGVAARRQRRRRSSSRPTPTPAASLALVLDAARRRPAGTAPAPPLPTPAPALPARRTGHGPPGGAGRRRTPRPDRPLVPGTPPAAPPIQQGTWVRTGTARPHRATTPHCCSPPAPPASATATARSGPPTWPGAATTNSSRSGHQRRRA